MLRDPLARHIPLQGARGELVVAQSGDAVLNVGLPKPPKGSTYEAWVAAPAVRAAGTFASIEPAARRTILNRSEGTVTAMLIGVEPDGGYEPMSWA